MKFESREEKWLFITGALFCALTGFWNIGIIAVDDYTFGIRRMIPAQLTSYAETLANTDIRSPIPSLLLTALGKLGWAFGLSSPIGQFRFSLALLGLFIFTVHSRSLVTSWKEDRSIRIATQGLLSFYFLCPLFFSRPLFENLGTPGLVLSAYFANRYWQEHKRVFLIWSVFFLSLGAIMRFQVGVVAPVLLFLPIIRRDSRGLLAAMATGILLFLSTGILDMSLTGSFHGSLRAYLSYNVKHSSGYGTLPFYTYFALLLGLSLPPTFLSRYREFEWREAYGPVLPAVLFAGVFILAHSFIPHKEERFLIPILPIFLFLLAPLLTELWKRRAWGRLVWFISLNGILLLLTSFTTPQKNMIELVRYLESHPEINRLIEVEDSFALYPQAFSLHSVPRDTVGASAIPQRIACGTVLGVRFDYESLLENRYRRLVEFPPGPLEQILVKMNPKGNRRRGAISLFGPSDCPRS